MQIDVSGITKSFERKTVLTDVSFFVAHGDTIGLLGPSGAGKSTLIRLLIGAIAADSGEISFGGMKVPNLKLMRKIGYMPQNDALYEELSGLDNLMFFGSLYGMKKQELSQRVADVLALTDLEAERKKLVRNYSGGMKKRLSLAAALLHEPEVLLLDEPTVGIDPVLRRTIWNRFHELKRKGNTILVSTHVMDEVTECDRAVLLYDGRLIHFDDVGRLLAQTEGGKIEELFFSTSKEVCS